LLIQWSGPEQRYILEDEEDKDLEDFNIILQPPPVVKYSWSP
jgi:hypothetical protein